MTSFEFPWSNQTDDIGTVTDWLVILLVYFAVMACLLVPIAMAAKAQTPVERAAVPAANAIDIVGFVAPTMAMSDA